MRRHSDLLEPCAGKLASTVLRGEGDSNVPALPDYWSSRMGKNPELSSRLALLLKKQKGKCSHCEFIFRNEDVMEVDHIVPRAIGGKDEYKNLQLLHRHCHDVKTKTDLELIRKHNLEIVSSGKKHPSKSEEREALK
ncbi:HNH endonuclease signature motif containing protein [Microcoleus sp. POL10_C6]|uniref:HNH endonuclease signature motif containing protein n=2 Tax=unclassified Microcoleus TaxID=2642155 RepID=UPI002FD2D631